MWLYSIFLTFTVPSAINFVAGLRGMPCAPIRTNSVLFVNAGEYLGRMVQKKKAEVDILLRQHQDVDDPLVMRMSYMASENKYNVTNSLKMPGDGPEMLHTMSVLCDLKRRSPTIPESRNIVEFASASSFAEVLTTAGVDGFFINLEESEYGGKQGELKDCVSATKAAKQEKPPACIAKDLIIHPMQVAKALEEGAGGVFGKI